MKLVRTVIIQEKNHGRGHAVPTDFFDPNIACRHHAARVSEGGAADGLGVLLGGLRSLGERKEHASEMLRRKRPDIHAMTRILMRRRQQEREQARQVRVFGHDGQQRTKVFVN